MGTDTNALAPYAPPLTNETKVDVGTNHARALLEEGSVKSWVGDVPVTLPADRWAPLTIPSGSGATTCAIVSGKPRCFPDLEGGPLSTAPAPRARPLDGLITTPPPAPAR